MRETYETKEDEMITIADFVAAKAKQQVNAEAKVNAEVGGPAPQVAEEMKAEDILLRAATSADRAEEAAKEARASEARADVARKDALRSADTARAEARGAACIAEETRNEHMEGLRFLREENDRTDRGNLREVIGGLLGAGAGYGIGHVIAKRCGLDTATGDKIVIASSTVLGGLVGRLGGVVYHQVRDRR